MSYLFEEKVDIKSIPNIVKLFPVLGLNAALVIAEYWMPQCMLSTLNKWYDECKFNTYTFDIYKKSSKRKNKVRKEYLLKNKKIFLKSPVISFNDEFPVILLHSDKDNVFDNFIVCFLKLCGIDNYLINGKYNYYNLKKIPRDNIFLIKAFIQREKLLLNNQLINLYSYRYNRFNVSDNKHDIETLDHNIYSKTLNCKKNILESNFPEKNYPELYNYEHKEGTIIYSDFNWYLVRDKHIINRIYDIIVNMVSDYHPNISVELLNNRFCNNYSIHKFNEDNEELFFYSENDNKFINIITSICDRKKFFD